MPKDNTLGNFCNNCSFQVYFAFLTLQIRPYFVQLSRGQDGVKTEFCRGFVESALCSPEVYSALESIGADDFDADAVAQGEFFAGAIIDEAVVILAE